MSNKERGEVTIKAGDDSYTIRFANKALCELEGDMGIHIQEILSSFRDIPSMTQTRQIFRRGLVEHHGEMELDKVSEIIDKVDYMELVAGLLTGIAGAFPVSDGSKKKKARARGNGKNR